MAVSFFVMFQAGCAVDPKVSALVDPIRALKFESGAVRPFWFSLVFAALAIRLSSGTSLSVRIVSAFGIVSVVGFWCWLIASWVEVWGVQSCFGS
jgi:hypothetical protein